MALLGEGLVVIWNDIRWAGREIFYRWHNQEHMPERVTIPGFLRGRRYRRDGVAEIEWLTLYETTGVDVLSGNAYLERLNNPTPWTREAVSHFYNVTRSLTEVAVSHGGADGGDALVAGYTVEVSRHPAAVAALGDLVRAQAVEPGICAVHLTVTDRGASSIVTAERRARATADESPDLVVLIEGSGPTAFERAEQRLQDVVGKIDGLTALRPPGRYRLEYQLEKRDR